MFAVASFSVMHVRLLVWKMREYRLFRRTQAFERFRRGNTQVGVMMIPLTLAMTVKVAFVKHLFPVAGTPAQPRPRLEALRSLIGRSKGRRQKRGALAPRKA